MKKLFFFFTFLVGLGISSSVYAQLVEVTLTSANTLASKLGTDVGKVTTLKVNGPLGAEDFKTMKEQMNMLQVLDMSGVTELPMVGLDEYNQEDKLPGIPANVFENKRTLQKVVFSKVLQRIGREAFSGCNILTKVDFTEAVQLKLIGSNAFYECSGLANLDLSACVMLEDIGGGAFMYCTNLLLVNLSGCGKLTDIKSSAFANCYSLQAVDLTGCSVLETIDSSAFYACSQLSDFDFTQLTALKEIRYSAFSNCSLTRTIVFASGIECVEDRVFSGNREITSFDFSQCERLTSLGSAFYGCEGLKKVDFTNCSALGDLDVDAFYGCLSLEEIVIDNNFYSSEKGVLFGGNKTSLLLYPAGKKEDAYIIPSTVQLLGYHSFPYNESLQKLTIPESVLSIKGNAFSGNNDYNSFSRNGKVIMKAVTPIGLPQSIGLGGVFVYVPKGSADAYRKAAIWNESKIIEIDAAPVTIALGTTGTLAEKLEEMNIPAYSIEDLTITGPMDSNDFEVIRKMEILQKADLNEAVLEEGMLFSSAFSLNKRLEVVVLPNSIKEIGRDAFYYLSALQKVNISEVVEVIGSEAFNNCLSLQEIDFSSLTSLRVIRNHAFLNAGITSVDFSNTSLIQIEHYVFAGCPITGTLSFPSTLQSIGSSAFSSAKVTSIKLKSFNMVRLEGADVFESVDKANCKVYVLKGLKETYKADQYWSAFKNIEEFGQLITVSINNEYAGRVEGGGAYETGETVTLKAIANTDVSFDGWYENGKKISTEPELTFKMGETDRSLEARFYSEIMTFAGGDYSVNDQNKVDGPAVLLRNGSLTVEGNEVWKPKSFAYYRDASLLVDAEIQTEAISFNWNARSNYWHFVSFPYDLKMSEIKLTSSDARFVVREYDGKSRADKGVGESWRQLSDAETLKANTGYIIQFNSGDGMADGFTTKTGDMKALFNRASVTIPLNTYASDNAMNANWNFVGNPYPAYYSVERLFADGLDATVTVWSPDLNNYEYYTQDDKDVYLTPLMAFFVQKKTSNLVFNPEGRVAVLPRETQAASALRSVDNRQVVNLLLAGEKASDRTRVVFNEEASMEYEIGLDAAKFSSPNKDAASFYSLDKDGNRLAINERPVADGVVRLGCVLPAKGSYTISLKEKIGKGIQLVDKQTGAVCDLNQEAYTFEAEAGTLSDRFELRSDVVTSVEAIDASIRWNVREGLLIVSGLRDVETLNVCDAVGRTHFAGKVTDGEVHIALPQSGIYYMTWTTKAGERQTRSIKW